MLIKETALNKATSIKYTDAILRSWKSKNIKTIQDPEHHKSKWSNGRKRNGFEVSTPDWLDDHERYRQSVKEESAPVDPEHGKNLLSRFQN